MQTNAPGKNQRSIFGRQKLDLGPYLGLGQGLGLGPIFPKFFGYSYTGWHTKDAHSAGLRRANFILVLLTIDCACSDQERGGVLTI